MNVDAKKEEALKQRFITLWDNNTQPGANCNGLEIWQQLAAYYSENGRYYHNLNHLLHCLKQMDLAYDYIDDPLAMELGLLFHDAIYDVAATDNEQRSADWFEQVAMGRFSPEFITRVKNLILSTTHTKIMQNNDEQLICDIDLSSFALSWEKCLRDSQLVRQEFLSMSDELYYPSKLKFLNAMLERPAFFQSDFFYQRYEQQAKENIGRQVSCINKTLEESSGPKFDCFNL